MSSPGQGEEIPEVDELKEELLQALQKVGSDRELVPGQRDRSRVRLGESADSSAIGTEVDGRMLGCAC